MKILVTGFKPFLGEKINPSEQLALTLQNKFTQVSAVSLKVIYSECVEELKSAIELNQPDILIMLGQAGGRSAITVEKIALNYHQARAADESGYRPDVGPIINHLPLAQITTFPVDDLVFAMSKNHSIETSCHAGTFVCNYLFHQALVLFPQLNPVFIHVPFLPEQIGHYTGEAQGISLQKPVMTFEDQKLIPYAVPGGIFLSI